MIHPNDEELSLPKAYVFKAGQATFWAYPVNDNRSGATPLWYRPWTWLVLGGVLALAYYVFG